MRNRSRTRIAALAVLALTALPLAACGSSGKSVSVQSGAHKQQGGTATLVFTNEGGAANYIFPVLPGANFSTSNSQDFEWLMWRPLYWYGTGGTPAINPALSLGDMPVYSSDGKTVTITLKPYKWSDGQPVTARDIQFWQNLINANPGGYGNSIPGAYPSNIVSTTVVNPTTIQFTFTKAYNQDWLLYNELSNIIPLPQHVWDKTSASGAVGDSDMTKQGALAVLAYLNGQAKQLTTYATNPLWQTVDGPWKLSAFSATNSDATFVPNPGYSGPVKPTLAQFKEAYYTDTAAEFSALSSGQGPDVGFISPVEQNAQPHLNRLGYTEVPLPYFEITYNVMNFNNPKLGPIFKQQYIRQAMQMLMDENGIDTNYFGGDAFRDCGPVPQNPPNSYADAYSKSCPFAYDPAKAAALLTAHGWNVVKYGVDTCQSPGTGPTQCGAGIAAGTKLEIPYIYGTGGIAYPKSRVQIATDFSLAGVKLDLKGLPGNEANTETIPCTPSQSVCSWGMTGSAWVFSPDYYPSGESLFATGASYNLGSYSDPKADQLIQATTLNTGESPQAALNAYQDYIIQQAPVIWEGVGYAPEEYRTSLHGVTPLNVFDAITPENWYYVK